MTLEWSLRGVNAMNDVAICRIEIINQNKKANLQTNLPIQGS